MGVWGGEGGWWHRHPFWVEEEDKDKQSVSVRHPLEETGRQPSGSGRQKASCVVPRNHRTGVYQMLINVDQPDGHSRSDTRQSIPATARAARVPLASTAAPPVAYFSRCQLQIQI